jgi:FlaA1/EpsC-like NDP-sugar epimerase
LTSYIENILGRKKSLFAEDLSSHAELLENTVQNASFLVIGGAGSIGKAVTQEIFRRNPKVLHVIDLNENGLAELVRDIRCTFQSANCEFKTFCIDICSEIFPVFLREHGGYDYVLNLSALKHVRSEKDPYTLMRMIQTNIVATHNSIELVKKQCGERYFAVSTDKASNPANMMGASKLLMEKVLTYHSQSLSITSARFANVAFSNGSLLESFVKRMELKQPIAAPTDIYRYFISPQESGELCLLSCLLGNNGDIFYPKLNSALHTLNFVEIATKYVESQGFKVHECSSAEEAIQQSSELITNGYWPCFFEPSSTTGEKVEEEFFTQTDILDLEQFHTIGVIKKASDPSDNILELIQKVNELLKTGIWSKKQLVELFNHYLNNFNHIEKFSYLDDKM